MKKKHLNMTVRFGTMAFVGALLIFGMVSCGVDEDDEPAPDDSTQVTPDPDPEPEPEPEPEPGPTPARQLTEEEVIGRWKGFYKKEVSHQWQIDHYYVSVDEYNEGDPWDYFQKHWYFWDADPIFFVAGDYKLFVYGHSDEDVKKIKELIETSGTGSVKSGVCEVYIENGLINWSISDCRKWSVTVSPNVNQITFLKNKEVVRRLRVTAYDGEELSLEEPFDIYSDITRPPVNPTDGYTYYDHYYKWRRVSNEK